MQTGAIQGANRYGWLLLWPKARHMEQGKTGHERVNNGNVHMMSHFLAILAIPFIRPVWQFNHMLRWWQHYTSQDHNRLAVVHLNRKSNPAPMCIIPQLCEPAYPMPWDSVSPGAGTHTFLPWMNSSRWPSASTDGIVRHCIYNLIWFSHFQCQLYALSKQTSGCTYSHLIWIIIIFVTPLISHP